MSYLGMNGCNQDLKFFFWKNSGNQGSPDWNEYLTGMMLWDKMHAGCFPARNLSMSLSLSLWAVTLKSHALGLKLNINSRIWANANKILKVTTPKARIVLGTVTQVYLVWAQLTVSGRDESAVAFLLSRYFRPNSLPFTHGEMFSS